MARDPQSPLNSLITVVVVVSLFRQIISLWMINCEKCSEELVRALQMDKLYRSARFLLPPTSISNILLIIVLNGWPLNTFKEEKSIRIRIRQWIRILSNCLHHFNLLCCRQQLTTVESAKHFTTKTIRNEMIRARVRCR